ncbi:MAG: hypothetical protein R6V20_04715 [Desulfobia sp.]
MEAITVIEHEDLPVIRTRSPGLKALSEEHASALLRLEKKLPAGTFFKGYRGVKFSQYCGIIALGNLTIEILPKIYGKEDEPGACRKALITMLARARKLKIQRGGAAGIALQKNILLDVFILDFCSQVNAEIMQGMISSYVERDENLNVLRGRLQLEKQFKHNLAHRERLCCRYDELSVDNAHNQVIKYVLWLMRKAAKGEWAGKQVSELLMRFDSVSDTTADLRTIDSLTFNRSTSRYKQIFNQCRWFVQGLHPDVLVGHNSCMTLLFDMNRLFESYVSGVFRKSAWMSGKKLRLQGPQKHMVRRIDRDKQLFLMRPDMVFLDSNNRSEAIMDAKWKILDEREKKLGISQADLYQMAGYAMRYGIDNLALVYPKQQRLQNEVDLEIQGTAAKLKVIPMDVTNPKLQAELPF